MDEDLKRIECMESIQAIFKQMNETQRRLLYIMDILNKDYINKERSKQ